MPPVVVEVSTQGSLCVTVQLPGVLTAASVSTEIEDGYVLCILTSTQPHGICERVRLPFAVDPDSCRVTFKKRSSSLKFTANAATSPTISQDVTSPQVSSPTGDPDDAPRREGCIARSSSQGKGLHDGAPTAASSEPGKDDGGGADGQHAPGPSLSATAPAEAPRHDHRCTEAPSPTEGETPAALSHGGADDTDGAAAQAPQDNGARTDGPSAAAATAATALDACRAAPCPESEACVAPLHAQQQHPPATAAPPRAAAAALACPPTPPRSPGGDSIDDATLYRGFFDEEERRPIVGAPPSPRGAKPACTLPVGSSSSSLGAACSTTASVTGHPPVVVAASIAGSSSRSSSSAVTDPPPPGPATAPQPTPNPPPAHSAGAEQPAAAPLTSPAVSAQAPGPALGTAAADVAPPIDCRYIAVANALALATIVGGQRASCTARQQQERKVSELVDHVAATLERYGYAVLDNFLPEALVKAARAELEPMEPHYSSGMIWVGKEAEAGAQISVRDVRGDVVLWLDAPALDATHFVVEGVKRKCGFLSLSQLLSHMDSLVMVELRRRLPRLAYLHTRSDAMMALYPGHGARFARHIDNTTRDGRRLTVVSYLNPGWCQAQGGALRLFPVRRGTEPVDVLPLCGRVAMFYSEEVAHEVMPSYAQRHAITLWYYDAAEHAQALAEAKAKMAGGAAASAAAQSAATELLKDLLADGMASTIEATPEGCRQLALRVAAMGDGALDVVAAVAGAPSGAALSESFQVMTPAKLDELRESLRSMGLGTRHHAPDTTQHVV